MTYLVKVMEPGDRPELTQWKEWRNVGAPSQLGAMAAHRHMRDRGGLADGQIALALTVYLAPEDVDRGADGEPLNCLAETFNVTRG